MLQVVDNLHMAAGAHNWQLGSIERASTTQQVLQELREAIVDGRIAQGEALREVSLAEAFGTGRSAVREAVRQLVQEGLVEYELHRGAFVRVMSLADRLDVYVAREAIEAGVARRLVDVSPPLDLSDLRDVLDELRSTAEGHDRVTEDLIDADIRFHQEFVRLGGSPRLFRAHETLAAETRMLLRHHPEYPWSDYVRDHERLFDAIEQRDPRAPDLVVVHLRLSARLIGAELSRGDLAPADEDDPARADEDDPARADEDDPARAGEDDPAPAGEDEPAPVDRVAPKRGRGASP